MNLKLFNEFMQKGQRPSQNTSEWQMFLEICEMRLKKKGIENPMAVELGIWKNRQKKFYEKLLGTEHISIDLTDRRGTPDIIGDTHDPEVKAALEEKLNGKPINILFIDAGHSYEDVKKDFYMYSPLCTDIIAFHDIECHRFGGRSDMKVWRFWDELRMKAYMGRRSYKKFLFISIFQYRGSGNRHQMGIGLMIRQ